MLDSFRFHHIGVVTSDINKTAGYYIDAGYRMGSIIEDTTQSVYISFLEKEGMPTIELITPASDSSPVNKTLERLGVSPYHFCYTVDDIDGAVEELKKKAYIMLHRPVEAVALGNKRICFMFNMAVGLIELLES